MIDARPAACFIHLRRHDQTIHADGQLSYSAGTIVQGSAGDEGVFARWTFTDGRLEIRNDRYGFHPLFYYCRPDELCVSPSIQTLLARGAPTKLDDDALAVFLRVGFFVGGYTPFAAIRAVPGDARVEWAADGPKVIGTRIPVSTPAEIRSRSAALQTYIELFRAAIRRRLPAADDRFTVPLSGGRDSRHILFELDAAGRTPPYCVTLIPYPPQGTDDATVARLLCDRLHINHRIVNQPANRIRAERRKNVETSFCCDEHVQYLPLADHLAEHVDTVYDGIGGDVLSGSLFISEEVLSRYRSRDIGRVCQYILEEYENQNIEPALGALLTNDAQRRFSRRKAEECLEDEIARHVDAPNPIGSFFFWNRTRREIALAPFALMRAVRTVHAPYLDDELYDFSTSLPAEMLLDRGFHTEAILRAFPQFAGIRFEQKSRRQVPRHYRRLAIDFLRSLRKGDLEFIRTSFCVSRFVVAALRGTYDPLWFLPLAVYLPQLHRVCGEYQPTLLTDS